VLDNPVWHALRGSHLQFAQGTEEAVRYHPDVTVFAALPDELSPTSWDALGALVGPGGGIALLRAGPIRKPAAWQEVFRLRAVQMVGTAVGPDEASDGGPSVEHLTAADVPAMLDLVRRTQPGPFAARTIELGAFVGIRHRGSLVAMAGERLHLPGHIEVSAVCTDAEYRGQGYGRVLVQAVVGHIIRAGCRPVLHVAEDNAGAIRLYERLGFARRRELEVVSLRAPDRPRDRVPSERAD
jgi:ribosomal protein S18 acetylase RimI-like enzyme